MDVGGGADSLAEECALELGLRGEIYTAAWCTYGRAAGLIRNQTMIESNPTEVLAFHDDITRSKGTKDLIRRAKAAGIPIKVVSHKGDVL